MGVWGLRPQRVQGRALAFPYDFSLLRPNIRARHSLVAASAPGGNRRLRSWRSHLAPSAWRGTARAGVRGPARLASRPDAGARKPGKACATSPSSWWTSRIPCWSATAQSWRRPPPTPCERRFPRCATWSCARSWCRSTAAPARSFGPRCAGRSPTSGRSAGRDRCDYRCQVHDLPADPAGAPAARADPGAWRAVGPPRARRRGARLRHCRAHAEFARGGRGSGAGRTGRRATLTLRRDGAPPMTQSVPVGTEQSVPIDISRAGADGAEFSTDPQPVRRAR